MPPNLKQHRTQLDAIGDNVFIPAITDGHKKESWSEKPIFPAVSDLEFANSRAATKHINSQDIKSPMNSEQLKTSRKRIANTRE